MIEININDIPQLAGYLPQMLKGEHLVFTKGGKTLCEFAPAEAGNNLLTLSEDDFADWYKEIDELYS